MEQKPSVGRIVHYVQYGHPDKHCAAIITEMIGEVKADLRVFTWDADFGIDESPYSEDHEHGTWHYPERV